jgi:hypothetical protein
VSSQYGDVEILEAAAEVLREGAAVGAVDDQPEFRRLSTPQHGFDLPGDLVEGQEPIADPVSGAGTVTHRRLEQRDGLGFGEACKLAGADKVLAILGHGKAGRGPLTGLADDLRGWRGRVQP